MIFICFLPIPEDAITLIKSIIPIENQFPTKKYIFLVNIILISSLKLLLNIRQTRINIIIIEFPLLAKIKTIFYETDVIE